MRPADRAANRLADLSPVDRGRMAVSLAAAAGPEQRAYIRQAFAAGHSVDELVSFAETIRGKTPGWLRTHLTLIDPSRPGYMTYRGAPVRQVDRTTCGSASILLAKAMIDPLYTLHLTTGGSADPAAAERAPFRARVAAEEQRIHDASNLVWPQRLGTSPWGVSGELNRHADVTGTEYISRLAVGIGGDSALRDAVAAVDSGHPAPVLIGDWIPRHDVWMVGRDGSDLLFYQPSRAAVLRVSEHDFRIGNTTALGFQHAHAVIVPRAEPQPAGSAWYGSPVLLGLRFYRPARRSCVSITTQQVPSVPGRDIALPRYQDDVACVDLDLCAGLSAKQQAEGEGVMVQVCRVQ